MKKLSNEKYYFINKIKFIFNLMTILKIKQYVSLLRRIKYYNNEAAEKFFVGIVSKIEKTKCDYKVKK